DVDLDSHLDLVLAGDTAAEILFGNGIGEFLAADAIRLDVGFGGLVVAVAAADFDADGVPDLAFGEDLPGYRSQCRIHVLSGTGSRRFGRPSFVSETLPFRVGMIAAADLTS